MYDISPMQHMSGATYTMMIDEMMHGDVLLDVNGKKITPIGLMAKQMVEDATFKKHAINVRDQSQKQIMRNLSRKHSRSK